MDPKFVGLMKSLQDSRRSMFISCIVQGILVTGFVITEQKFFVETNRIMHDEMKSSLETRTYWEEVLLPISKMPIENAALHLTGVKMYLPGGVQNIASLRIDPSQVSAWNFVLPEDKDSSEYLPQFLDLKPQESD